LVVVGFVIYSVYFSESSSDVFTGSPRWTPDGKKIAFMSAYNGKREIYIMNADGSGQTRLTGAE